MGNYAELDSNGIVFAITQSVTPPNGNFVQIDDLSDDYLGASWDGESFIFPQPPAEPTTFGRIITVLAYSSRFTAPEVGAIELAAQGSGATAATATHMLRRLGWASHIFLDDPRTVSETQGLEAAGFIGAGRADEIIGDPVYSNEVIKEARIAYGLPLVPTAHELAQNGGKGYASPSEIPNG